MLIIGEVALKVLLELRLTCRRLKELVSPVLFREISLKLDERGLKR